MISDLRTLLAGMKPELDETEYLFVSVDSGRLPALTAASLLSFRENEGFTLVLPKEGAERSGLPYRYPCRKITLSVCSDLAAVGFLAEICRTLADAGISVNPVSAFYHDHLFVPSDRAEEALGVLEKLAARYTG